jgi:hypothetical protein
MSVVVEESQCRSEVLLVGGHLYLLDKVNLDRVGPNVLRRDEMAEEAYRRSVKVTLFNPESKSVVTKTFKNLAGKVLDHADDGLEGGALVAELMRLS